MKVADSNRFQLPNAVRKLVEARNELRNLYLDQGRKFTLDGNLVGDIGEVIAARLFGLELVNRGFEGVDGVAPDKRTVQIKATGTGRGPAFRPVDTKADHLVFLDLDFENLVGDGVYNGPENLVRKLLPDQWEGQRPVFRRSIEFLAREVAEIKKLARVDL